MEEYKRPAIFFAQEISKLMTLVNAYKEIIENKKTDSSTWKEKSAAWKTITEEFNINNSVYRSTINIRGKYENMKKTAKKKFAIQKREVYKTGGGPFTPIDITPHDLQIKEMLGVSADGLESEFDGDNFKIIFENEDEKRTKGDTNWASLLKKPISAVLSNKDNMSANIGTEQQNDSPLQENNSQLNINPSSENENIIVEHENDLATHSTSSVINKSKRTPIRTNNCRIYKKKTNLTNDCRIKINTLSETKVELIRLQMHALKKEINQKEIEHKQKVAQTDIEHNLRVEEAKLRIQVLQNQL